jgi:hypothetical protein
VVKNDGASCTQILLFSYLLFFYYFCNFSVEKKVFRAHFSVHKIRREDFLLLLVY